MSLTVEQKNTNILNRFEAKDDFKSISKITVMVGDKKATIISTVYKTEDEFMRSCKQRWPSEQITKVS